VRKRRRRARDDSIAHKSASKRSQKRGDKDTQPVAVALNREDKSARGCRGDADVFGDEERSHF